MNTCPACAQPLDEKTAACGHCGAPPAKPPLTDRERNRRGVRTAGCAVIGLGLLSIFALPNLLADRQRERQQQAMTEMTATARAIAAHAHARKAFPQAEGGTALCAALAGAGGCAARDPWGTEYRYETWSEADGPHYALVCAGSDRTFEAGSARRALAGGSLGNTWFDLAIVDGTVIQGPGRWIDAQGSSPLPAVPPPPPQSD